MCLGTNATVHWNCLRNIIYSYCMPSAYLHLTFGHWRWHQISSYIGCHANAYQTKTHLKKNKKTKPTTHNSLQPNVNMQRRACGGRGGDGQTSRQHSRFSIYSKQFALIESDTLSTLVDFILVDKPKIFPNIFTDSNAAQIFFFILVIMCFQFIVQWILFFWYLRKHKLWRL